MSGIPSAVYVDTGFADFITLHQAGEVFNIYEAHVALEKLETIVERRDSYKVDASMVKDIVGVEAFGKRMLISLAKSSHRRPEYHYSKRVSGPVALHRVMNGNGNGNGVKSQPTKKNKKAES
ncbi:hypothetical protein [Sinorhizobium psoraleae]|uniref:Uncharacterized protein n=1 Tax=Sinorhizobium psoraleae TaxID=520838 RepID=A0ABT4KAJ5_9HYPH|nr:hypothetical protein [Sinorhizobium psoraleae]MCZ4088859.1 hypothetical protein [Sinorhizobium psoraleae]